MEGYIVAMADSENDDPNQYWDGTAMQEDDSKSHFFSSRADAKTVFGPLQAQYNNKEALLLKARLTLEIIKD